MGQSRLPKRQAQCRSLACGLHAPDLFFLPLTRVVQCVLKVSGRGSWTRNSQRDWSTNAAADAIVYTGGMAHLTLGSHLEEGAQDQSDSRRWRRSVSIPRDRGYGWALDSHRHMQLSSATGEIVGSGPDCKVRGVGCCGQRLLANGVMASVCQPLISVGEVTSNRGTSRHGG